MRWHYQWFFADGVSHILFLVVVLAIVCMWFPSENSKRYAFSRQLGSGGEFPEPEGIGEDGEDREGGITSEIGDVEEVEEPKGKQVAPETIGAVDSDQDL